MTLTVKEFQKVLVVGPSPLLDHPLLSLRLPFHPYSFSFLLPVCLSCPLGYCTLEVITRLIACVSEMCIHPRRLGKLSIPELLSRLHISLRVRELLLSFLQPGFVR